MNGRDAEGRPLLTPGRSAQMARGGARPGESLGCLEGDGFAALQLKTNRDLINSSIALGGLVKGCSRERWGRRR
jgi:hypothetical protein